MTTQQPTNKAATLPDIAGIHFNVHKMRETSVLWVHPGFVDEGPSGVVESEQVAQRFNQRFAFGIADSACFAEIGFDRGHSRCAFGERYGGRGIGDNGGGVRVGNFDGYQVKGIGQNALVGRTATFLHSYGALTAGEAMYEAIYAYLLNTIMPVGAVGIHGIILTGAQTAYLRYLDEAPQSASAEFKCWGALMVRDICRRPAHFLRAAGHVPRHTGGIRLAPDVARVRAANKALFLECGGLAGFIELLLTFLHNCAWQFAFSRVHSLAHGTLTPSNLALDGRWLDLARTTFYPVTQDNGAFLSSASEWRYPLAVVEEWTYAFAKYNQLELDVKPLTQHYERQFHQASRHCVLALCGLEWPDTGKARIDAACTTLSNLSLRIIDAPKTRAMSLPLCADAADPVRAWLTWLMCPGMPIGADAMCALHKLFSTQELRQARFAYHRIAKEIYSMIKESSGPMSYRSFLSERMIATTKSLYLQEFFYKKRLDDVIFDTLRHKALDASKALIDETVSLIDWAYGKQPVQHTWLYRSQQLAISRDHESGQFFIMDGCTRSYAHAAQVMCALDDMPDTRTQIAAFQFKPYLRHVLALLHTLERHSQPKGKPCTAY